MLNLRKYLATCILSCDWDSGMIKNYFKRALKALAVGNPGKGGSVFSSSSQGGKHKERLKFRNWHLGEEASSISPTNGCAFTISQTNSLQCNEITSMCYFRIREDLIWWSFFFLEQPEWVFFFFKCLLTYYSGKT